MMRRFFVAACVLFLPGTAVAAETTTLRYLMYYGGLAVAEATFTMRLTDEIYALRLDVKPRDTLSWAVEGGSTVRAEGRIGGSEGLVPVRYTVDSAWNGNRRWLQATFGPTGRLLDFKQDIAEPQPWDDRAPVPEALRHGPDPLTLGLLVGLQAMVPDRPVPQEPRGRWQRRAPVAPVAVPPTQTFHAFNGKAAAAVEVACDGWETLERAVDGGFAGEAARCAVGGRQTAGLSAPQREDPDRGTFMKLPGTAWLARLADGQPLVPVRAQLDTRAGTILMHLVAWDDAAAGG